MKALRAEAWCAVRKDADGEDYLDTKELCYSKICTMYPSASFSHTNKYGHIINRISKVEIREVK